MSNDFSWDQIIAAIKNHANGCCARPSIRGTPEQEDTPMDPERLRMIREKAERGGPMTLNVPELTLEGAVAMARQMAADITVLHWQLAKAKESAHRERERREDAEAREAKLAEALRWYASGSGSEVWEICHLRQDGRYDKIANFSLFGDRARAALADTRRGEAP